MSAPPHWIRLFTVARVVELVAVALLLLPVSVRAAARPPVSGGDAYALNLRSSRISPLPLHLPALPAFRAHQIYVLRSEVNGKIWHRIRLGFYGTRAEAEEAMVQIKAMFPAVWVAKVDAKEQAYALHWADAYPGSGGAIPALPKSTAKPPPPVRVASAEPVPANAGKSMAPVMAEAKSAMLAKNYRHAIALYTKVLQSDDASQKQRAQELLGVARERNHQLAFAVAEYKTYLRLYPDGEAADRVRQRLAALLSVNQGPKARMSHSANKADNVVTDIFGSLSQFYRRDVSETDAAGSNVDQEYLITDLDLVARRRSKNYDMRALFNGGYRYQFVDNGFGADTQIRYLYVDVNNRKKKISGRLGRQSLNSSGVLGRFDGGQFTYPLSQHWRANVVAGYPVNLMHLNSVQTNKHFVGVSLDAGTFAKHWDFNTYTIRQTNDGYLDRQAVGGEVRYSSLKRTLYSLVDYDTSYKRVNIAMLLFNWRFDNSAMIGVTADYRRTPVLTTGNALIGQSVTSLDALSSTYSEDEMRALALDRTPIARTLTLSGSYPLKKKLQFSVNVTQSNLSPTAASGGVEATPSTGDQTFYSTQLVATDFFKQGDITILGLRYSDTGTVKTVSLLGNTRLPFGSKWRVNPRLRVDRQERSAGGTVVLVSPTIRVDYRFRRHLNFELESGYRWYNDSMLSSANDQRSYYLSVGYRWDFQ
ncbi:MAG TPA: SPOR domain-containing protein [Gammaproteobacteria bacterium]|nr:SPOR domain-containing protein [Gammaproteobacteria bacterium]